MSGLIKVIQFCGKTCAVACDGKCHKAWGIGSRPKVQLSDDDDDFAYLADSELGNAPIDPGTYEGGCAKPIAAEMRLNKWCARECERSTFADLGEGLVEIRDFSKRVYNLAAPSMPDPRNPQAQQKDDA